MRHYREGFTRVFINDLNDVEPQLQEFDPSLYLMWNPKTGEHLIVDGMTDTAVMKIPQIGFPELTSKVVERVMAIKWGGRLNALEEVVKSENKKEKEMQKFKEDISHDVAREVVKKRVVV